MKKNGHPLYQEVLFVDSATGFSFVCGSTLQTKERQTYEGKEYPVKGSPTACTSGRVNSGRGLLMMFLMINSTIIREKIFAIISCSVVCLCLLG